MLVDGEHNDNTNLTLLKPIPVLSLEKPIKLTSTTKTRSSVTQIASIIPIIYEKSVILIAIGLPP